MEKQLWQDEWPTEPGMWWLYGWRFKKFPLRKKEKPELFLVEVRKTQNSLVAITMGHFLFKEEGAEGKWSKATLPPLPKGVKPR